MAVAYFRSDTLTGLRRTPLCWTPLDGGRSLDDAAASVAVNPLPTRRQSLLERTTAPVRQFGGSPTR